MRVLIASMVVMLGLVTPGLAQSWDDVVAKSRGQTVFWNAWGGDERINAYVAWAGEQVRERYGVTVEHVRLSDTSDAVARVVAELGLVVN